MRRARALAMASCHSAICSHAGVPYWLAEKGRGRQRTCLNAFAIIPNLILGTSAEVVFGPALGVLRRFR